MHRLASVPGLPEDSGSDGSVAYVEQPPAPVLLLSSADTDLVSFATLLGRQPGLLGVEARALNLAALAHPAVIDHYLTSTVRHARLVLVRLLGGRGHWAYGLEQLQDWARQPDRRGGRRHLLVLSGTPELDRELAALGTIPEELAIALATCLRIGGPENLEALLQTLAALLQGREPAPPSPRPAADPLPHDWRDEPGPRVGVILYRALQQAGDTALMEAVLAALRSKGLAPRGLWVSSLRDGAVQRGVGDLLQRETVEAVLCGTGFATVSFEEAGLGAPLWERLAVPVLQLLVSGRPRRAWHESAIGLGPLDLTLQVALPELDGRIGTRVGAFKEVSQAPVAAGRPIPPGAETGGGAAQDPAGGAPPPTAVSETAPEAAPVTTSGTTWATGRAADGATTAGPRAVMAPLEHAEAEEQGKGRPQALGDDRAAELPGAPAANLKERCEPRTVVGAASRPGADLATALQRVEPDRERLRWIAALTDAWIRLRRTPAAERGVALVLANYPTRNSRLANGVGLDTPASTAAMLRWLREAGYDLGDGPLPPDGDALIQALLAGRTNDPESGHRPPLAHLPLTLYDDWYGGLPAEGRRRLERIWGPPRSDAGLEVTSSGAGFPIRGLRFGRVVVLIQPERGYDRDPSLSYHSPDLPPTHAYLAQYLWLRQVFGAQVVVHVGKHGNLEWLPGKGVGLSNGCFPEWALGPMPHLYPFIVNDPGEGSQAKRRAQAVILDHLTPPLGRAGLHGELQALEALLDEYWEARSLGGERAATLRQRLAEALERLQLPDLTSPEPPAPEPGPVAPGSEAPANAAPGAERERPVVDPREASAEQHPAEPRTVPSAGADAAPPHPPATDALAGAPALTATTAITAGTAMTTSAVSPRQGGRADPLADLDARLDAADGYLCEIKEAQIRLGLHRYGHLPDADALLELLLSLARPPQEGLCGLTQALARDLGLQLDPWADPEEQPLAGADRTLLARLPSADPAMGGGPARRAGADPADARPAEVTATQAGTVQAEEAAPGVRSCERQEAAADGAGLRRCGDGTARLEAWALRLLRDALNQALTRPDGPAAEDGAASEDIKGAEMPTIPEDTTAPQGTVAAGEEPAVGPQTRAVLRHVRERLLPALLRCGEAERQAFLTGLEGGRIAAGPSGAPTRGRPDLLPTGRNFYSVDLRGLPTEAAWDLGRRSAELLLDLHRLEQGEELRTLALSVWGTATMRNGGEDIAQALALMGVRPVWDGPSRRIVDLEVIPLSLLGRPRVDVTLRISGLFRDAFPQLVGWMNRATRLVAGLSDEGEANPLAQAALREGSWGRVFGSAPGAYGAGLQGLIDSGQWDNRADLANAFLNWSQWRYDGEMLSGAGGLVTTGGAAGGGDEGLQGRHDRAGLEQRLAQVQVVLHNQDNREHDLLDSDDYYQFHGGLSAAVETLRGARPQLWFGDHSRSARPRLHRVEKEFDKVLRSRLLNPRWIEAMQQHGYKGGFEMAASLDYLFAYDASSGRVPDWSYGAISQTWLNDARVLDFLRRHNPWALRDMAERLLEAQQRGLWEGAPAEEIERLRELVLDSEALIEAG